MAPRSGPFCSLYFILKLYLMLLYERGRAGRELSQLPLCANVLFIMRVSEISCEVVEGPKGRSEDRGGVIPPPPEFSNDPGPPALQYLGRRGSPVRNKFSNLGQPLDAGPAASEPRGFSHFPGGARYAGTRGLERFSGGGRSLIKKRLYVGEPHHSPGLSRGGTSRSLSSPNCFGPQPGGPFGAPGGPEMRRVNSAGRAPHRGLQARRMSLEGSARGEAKYKAPGGDHGFAPATGR